MILDLLRAVLAWYDMALAVTGIERIAVIENQPGWRYDVYVLGPPPTMPGPSEVADASEEEISKALADSEKLFQAGFRPQAIAAAWAALESAMRHKLRTMGDEAGWGTSPRTMLNELVSSGVLSQGEFRDLEGISRLRNIIVHGFSAPETGYGAVTFLSDIARRLLAESKQPAPVHWTDLNMLSAGCRRAA